MLTGLRPGHPVVPTFWPTMPTVAPSPADLRMLFEVVRTDFQREWAAGHRPRVRDYAATVPELFADPATARQLDELERQLTADAAARLTRTPPPVRVLDLDRTEGSPVTPTPPLPLAPSRRSDADRPAPFPEVGDTVAGFRLTGELGRGAFGRVYLAEQQALAGRQVALKITARGSREAQRLAKLRHTNVVPVYSVHDLPGLQAVCMPVLGRLTLADLVADFRRTGSFAGSVASTVCRGANSTARSVPAPAVPASRPPVAVPAEVAAKLAGLGHVARVLWLGERVAAGLAHAHAAGILHLDLKPANVLLADDGEPVLVDFNLSYDTVARDRDRAGGTLPYMAPEQLDDYRLGGPPQVDARTDLFGLGVVLSELLTGRQPYPVPTGRPNLLAMAADRRLPPPRLRPLNADVPAAVEAIVLKLLAPNPADRYQSAADLVTDLQHQQADRPLQFAPDRSPRERVGKWHRRHPTAWQPTALAVALVLAGGLGYYASTQAAAVATADAREKAGGVAGELLRLRADLTAVDDPLADADRVAGKTRAVALLAAHGLPDDPDWRKRPALADLPAGERAAAQDALGELALLLAHAETLDSRPPAEPDPSAYERARRWNRAAELAYTGRPLPKAVAAQRKRLGPDLTPPAAAAVDVPAVDLFLAAADALADSKPAAAIAPLEELCRLAPGHFAAQFALADCRQRTADGAKAAERFAVAAALAPADARPHYHRGRLLFEQTRWAEATAAITAAIDRRAGCWEFHYQRALGRRKTSDPVGAVADVRTGIDAGGPAAVFQPLLAELLTAAGDKAGAAAAAAEAGRSEPRTAVEFVLRGRGRLAADPVGAEADFDRATKLSPHYPAAWLSLAYVRADRLDRPDDARSAADQAVVLAPHDPRGWASRAVINARLGDRAAAHADADRAVKLSDDPQVAVWAACTFALTSGGHPDDADRAAGLLRQAVRAGYKDRAKLLTDPDLAAVRQRTDVKRLMAE